MNQTWAAPVKVPSHGLGSGSQQVGVEMGIESEIDIANCRDSHHWGSLSIDEGGY